MRLRDKKVVVIGGTSGMGLATARLALEQGAQVVVASRTADRVAQAVAQLGANAGGQTVDTCSEALVQSFFGQLGRIDHLVLPGSSVRTGPLRELPLEDAHYTMDSKFFGPYCAAKYADISRDGSITFFSGILSRRPGTGMPILAATNAAVEALGRALALELAPVRVNVISPGLTRDTGAFAAMPETAREEMFANTAAALPVQRVGRPDDIAALAVALMTNPFITGSVIDIDGGGLLA